MVGLCADCAAGCGKSDDVVVVCVAAVPQGVPSKMSGKCCVFAALMLNDGQTRYFKSSIFFLLRNLMKFGGKNLQ